MLNTYRTGTVCGGGHCVWCGREVVKLYSGGGDNIISYVLFCTHYLYCVALLLACNNCWLLAGFVVQYHKERLHMAIRDLGSSTFLRRAVCGAAAVHALLALRLLPDVVQRLLFTFNLMLTMGSANAVLIVINALRSLRVVGASRGPGYCAVVSTLFSRLHRLLSPHIGIVTLPGSMDGIGSMPRPNVVLMNHTSFFDTVLFQWTIRPSYMMHMKTFYKASLANVPLVGRIITSSEMLPVYFLSEDNQEFRVDRVKQEKVTADTHKFLSEGGSIAFFPEGGINRVNVRELLPFRHGSFQRVIEFKRPLFFMLHVGSQDVWPQAGLAGGAANVYLYFGKIDVDYDDTTLTAKTLAEKAHAVMQDRLNWMYSVIEKRDA